MVYTCESPFLCRTVDLPRIRAIPGGAGIPVSSRVPALARAGAGAAGGDRACPTALRHNARRMEEYGMVRVCALGLSLLLAASTAFAQVSATTGSINGKVSDATGGVLPGVTVTASSPACRALAPTSRTRTATIASRQCRPENTSHLRAGRLWHRRARRRPGRPRLHRDAQHRDEGRSPPGNGDRDRRSRRSSTSRPRRSATNFGEERLAALPNARDFWTVLAAAPGDRS